MSHLILPQIGIVLHEAQLLPHACKFLLMVRIMVPEPGEHPPGPTPAHITTNPPKDQHLPPCLRACGMLHDSHASHFSFSWWQNQNFWLTRLSFWMGDASLGTLGHRTSYRLWEWMVFYHNSVFDSLNCFFFFCISICFSEKFKALDTNSYELWPVQTTPKLHRTGQSCTYVRWLCAELCTT